jgi:hypothetical protein
MVKRMLAPRGGSKCKTAQLLKGQSVRRALHSRDGNLLGRLLRPQLARRNIACHELR